MNTDKMVDLINGYKKEYVYEQYTRIVYDYKKYDNITKKKMIQEIYKVYSDYNNIIDICTTRELKYLKKLLSNNGNMKDLLGDKYKWERRSLSDKFITCWDFDRVFIPLEIKDIVKEAIKKVDWDIAKRNDRINEIVVGFCKVQGVTMFGFICSVGSILLGIDEETLWNFMLNNRLFNYYVFLYDEHLDNWDKPMLMAVYQDYYSYKDEFKEGRVKYKVGKMMNLDTDMFKTIFYNDFDIRNKKIKKFIDELMELPFFWRDVLEEMKVYTLLNLDRDSLKKAIREVPVLRDYDLDYLFKDMDLAMDEMPSGVLNGLTPIEYRELCLEDELAKYEIEKDYVKQKDACLSESDASLFYKIYFGLLEFTNDKYVIKKNLKLYGQEGINPQEIVDIIDKFWQNKSELVDEFCTKNPYGFNKEELDITSKFKDGIRDMFIFVKFEEDYTAVMDKNRVYMIKGINDNLDNIISYEDLPHVAITSIIPFKNYLIYDGILIGLAIKMGNNMVKTIMDDYDKSMKYYHM